MKHLFILTLTLISLFYGATIHSKAFGAWWLEKYSGQNRIEVSDEEFYFTLGNDIKCIISKTNFRRMPDDQIAEYRDMTCWVSDDISVTIRAHCNHPLYSLTDMQINKRGETYWPTLLCGKKK